MKRNRRRTVLAAAVMLAAGGVATLGSAVPSGTAAATEPPRNTVAPTVTPSSPHVGQTVTASPGTWVGTLPMTFAYQWRRCNTAGGQCVAIPNATAQSYEVRQPDQGFTLRVRVTARNASGSRNADSAATATVAAAPAPPPPGSVIPITSVSLPNRLVVQDVQFSPNPVTSATAPITVRVRVADSGGRFVSGALVFVRSTPLVTTAPAEAATGADGWVTFTTMPRRDFQILFRPGYNLQFFVRARKPNEDQLGGVSSRRLVQVRLAPQR